MLLSGREIAMLDSYFIMRCKQKGTLQCTLPYICITKSFCCLFLLCFFLFLLVSFFPVEI